jgi:hypothetical protein
MDSARLLMTGIYAARRGDASNSLPERLVYVYQDAESWLSIRIQTNLPRTMLTRFDFLLHLTWNSSATCASIRCVFNSKRTDDDDDGDGGCSCTVASTRAAGDSSNCQHEIIQLSVLVITAGSVPGLRYQE